jgi:hypothetical protein
MKNETHPNTSNMISKERMEALQEVRTVVDNLWMLVVNSEYTDNNEALNFLTWEERSPARESLKKLSDDITLFIHGELGSVGREGNPGELERYRSMVETWNESMNRVDPEIVMAESFEETVGIMEEVRNV